MGFPLRVPIDLPPPSAETRLPGLAERCVNLDEAMRSKDQMLEETLEVFFVSNREKKNHQGKGKGENETGYG